MKKNRSSDTAQLTALARAGIRRDYGPKAGPDHLAEKFLDAKFRWVVGMRAGRALASWMYTRRMPGVYGFLQARTRYFDEVFEKKVRDGVKQVVLLGAGFDSRPYRFADALAKNGVRVFELDFPATSALKQEKARALFGAPPAHVRYVPVDFNATPQLHEPLTTAGYDRTQPTLFLWEGVSLYLTEDAVGATFRFVADHAGPGSAIVFDFIDARALEDGCTLFGAREGRAFVASKGEPFLFGMPPDGTGAFVARHGLRCEEVLLPVDLEKRYVRPDGAEKLLPLAEYNGMAVAVRD